MVQYGRPSRSSWAKSVRSSSGRLLWERQFEKILLIYGWEKVPNWECFFVHRKKRLFLSVYVDDIKLAGKKQNIDLMWKVLNKEVDLGEPTSFFDHVYLGCTQRQYEISKDIVDNYRTMFESRISAGWTEKLPYSENFRISSWSYDMEGHAKKCVERYCELANKTTQQLYNVSTPCIDDHHFEEEELKSVGELSQVCSQIVLKFLCLARIGRPDILWSANKLARSITKWTKACDKRLNRLISCIQHTCEYNNIVMWETLLSNADWDCFRTLILQEIFRIQNLHQVELCAFLEVIHLFQSVVCARNKLQFHTVQQDQKSFLWMQDWGWMVFPLLTCGIWSLQFLETRMRTMIERGDPLFAVIRITCTSNLEECSMFWTRIRTEKNTATCQRTNVKLVLLLTRFTNASNLKMWSMIWMMLILFTQTSHLLIRKLCCMCLQTTKQWFKMIIKDRSPTVRHVSRTHRVALDWLFWQNQSGSKTFKSSTSTPNTNSMTYCQKGTLHVMIGTIFFIFLTSAISEFQLGQPHENDGEKDARTDRRRQDRGKVKADDESGLTCLDKFFDCAETDCVEAWGHSKHFVEQIGQVHGNLTQENSIKTQRRVLKRGKTKVRGDS